MTRRRYDRHSTEFGLWLREQGELDSSLGFTATNLDYIWHDYKQGFWMLLEEKRHLGKVTWSQSQIFQLIHAAAQSDPKYKGFHIIRFSVTSPDDGLVFLDGKQVSNINLTQFLRFEKPDSWYEVNYQNI